MKVLDSELDTKPTAKKVLRMAELRNQNLLCFKELQSFNDTGKWLYLHPLISNRSERAILLELKRKNPAEFLRQYSATDGNIRRYKSFLKNKSRESRRETDKKHLQAHLERAAIFKSILDDEQNHS